MEGVRVFQKEEWEDSGLDGRVDCRVGGLRGGRIWGFEASSLLDRVDAAVDGWVEGRARVRAVAYIQLMLGEVTVFHREEW